MTRAERTELLSAAATKLEEAAKAADRRLTPALAGKRSLVLAAD